MDMAQTIIADDRIVNEDRKELYAQSVFGKSKVKSVAYLAKIGGYMSRIPPPSVIANPPTSL